MPQAKREVFENKSVELAAFARAISHPVRIEILRFLAKAGEVPCMTIVAALPLSQPACSRHINDLRRAGLLRARKNANQILFRIDASALETFCKGMNEALHPKL